MIGQISKVTGRFGQYLNQSDYDELMYHPLKRLSRRFLHSAFWWAILLHFGTIAGIDLFGSLRSESSPTLDIAPYPAHLIEMINPNTLVTTDRGGGRPGRSEPPADPMDDVMSRGKVVPVVVAIPEPVDDHLISENHEIAPQEETEPLAIAYQDVEAEFDETGVMGGSGMTGSGETNAGEGGTGNGMGDGTSETWTYDKPPMPIRINMSISRKEIPRKLRHLKDIFVRLQLLIDERGKVVDASMIESTGYPEIDEILLEKIYSSHYQPATLAGRSVKAWFAVRFGYRVRG